MKITYQAANAATQFFTSKARVTMMCLQRLKRVDLAPDFSPYIPQETEQATQMMRGFNISSFRGLRL